MVAAGRTPRPAGAALPFEEAAPCVEPVDGAGMLSDVTETVRRYVVVDPHQATICALWVTLTHLAHAATVLPILAVTSPEKGCGKSTLLALVGRLASRPVLASNVSPAALFRCVEAWMPTLCIDEGDSFLRDNDELRGILNSGHTRDTGYVIRTVGEAFEPRLFRTFCPKAIALIGKLPDTLQARSLCVTMRRKAPGEAAESLRHADTREFDLLRSRLVRWAQDSRAEFAAARPALPGALQNRAGDNAEPLLAIADLAGGQWPEKARAAVLTSARQVVDTMSLAEELLTGIRRARDHLLISDPRAERVPTHELLAILCADEEARWATYNRGTPMTPRQLAQRLAPFGIAPHVRRIGSQPQRGYLWSQFAEVFARYLPPAP